MWQDKWEPKENHCLRQIEVCEKIYERCAGGSARFHKPYFCRTQVNLGSNIWVLMSLTLYFSKVHFCEVYLVSGCCSLASF